VAEAQTAYRANKESLKYSALCQGATLQAAEKLLPGGRPGIYPRHNANGIKAGFSL
jgi:hypothetical protein